MLTRTLGAASLALFAGSAALASSSSNQGAPIDATKVGPQPTAPAVLTAPAASHSLASGWSDDFNRPDSGTLGVDWLLQTGSFAIQSNRGAAVATGNQWVRHVSASAQYDDLEQSIDFHAAPTAQVMYVALVSGIGASADNVFVKVQDNTSDGTFDRLFIYRGINGSPFTSPYFFDLAVPVTQGRMTVFFTNNGDTVNIEIDSNFDGVAEETFGVSGVLSAGLVLGNSFGIGCFNQPRFDNWQVGAPPPSIANFCTAGTTSSGCVATLTSTGSPSVAQSSGFSIQAASVEGQKQGLFFYGVSGEVAFPWGTTSSWFCVKTPTQRFALQNSGGTPGQCDGALSVDFLSYVSSTPWALGAPFSAGDNVWMQAWFRDPPSSKTTMLTDGLFFAMQP